VAAGAAATPGADGGGCERATAGAFDGEEAAPGDGGGRARAATATAAALAAALAAKEAAKEAAAALPGGSGGQVRVRMEV
jgi:hypothetical protein